MASTAMVALCLVTLAFFVYLSFAD